MPCQVDIPCPGLTGHRVFTRAGSNGTYKLSLNIVEFSFYCVKRVHRGEKGPRKACDGEPPCDEDHFAAACAGTEDTEAGL
jgi:hypothetical protein